MKFPECERCGRLSPRMSVVGNFSMAVFKFTVGMLAGSKGLVADSLHSVADTIASAFVLVALKISGKPKDRQYPYGLGKVEYFSSMFAGTLIFICAVSVLIDALESIRSGVYTMPDNGAILATILSLCFSWLMYSSNTCAGTQLNSPAMLADAAESKADSLTSIAVLLGLIGTKLGFHSADALAAVVVAAFIFKISVEMFLGGIHGLIDVSLDREDLQEIRRLCMQVEGVEGIGAVKSRRMGQKSQLDIDLDISHTKTIMQTQEIVRKVKAVLSQRLDTVDHVIVRTFPVKKRFF